MPEEDDMPIDAPSLIVDDGCRSVSPVSLPDEAISLLLDGPYLPRLVYVLVRLGLNQEAKSFLSLQASVLAKLTTRRRVGRS